MEDAHNKGSTPAAPVRTVVNPGAGRSLFKSCIAQYLPQNLNAFFVNQYPALFPTGTDHFPLLEEMYMNPSLAPREITLRSLGTLGGTGRAGAENGAIGESKYYFDRYLKRRGDANIKDLTDLINKSKYYAAPDELRAFLHKPMQRVMANGPHSCHLLT